jgi:hypothetical protein
MNERIKSLLAKAHLDVMEDLGDIDSNHVAEKFAELIVKECADKAYKTAWDDLTLGYGIGVIPLHISNTIKEHFGVEE